METVDGDGKVTATAQQRRDQGRRSTCSSRLRWDDNSMGSTFDYNWGTINQAFAAGQIGMFTGGSDLYTAMVQNNNLNPTTTASRRSRSRPTRTPASSAAAPSPRSTSTPTEASATRPSTGSTSTT